MSGDEGPEGTAAAPAEGAKAAVGSADGVREGHSDDGRFASAQCTYPYETLGLPRVARVMIHRLRARIRRRLVAILLVAFLVLMITFDFEYVFSSLEVAIPAKVIFALAGAWTVCAALLYCGVVRPLKRLHRLSGTARGRGGTPALIEAVASRQYQRVVEATSRRGLPAVPVQDQGDASVIVPVMAEMEHRLECRLGSAFPIVDSKDSLQEPRFAAAWRVHEIASPLMAASGKVVDTLVFEVHSRLKESSDSQTSTKMQVHVARFYRVEFTDDGGSLRRIWSDSLWGRFDKGAAVTVYWYRIASGAHAGIRIHDIADASLPVDVRDHAAQLFNFAWSDVAEWLSDGRPVKKRSIVDSLHDAMMKDIQLGPTMAPVRGSYGEALAGKPWGKQYRFLPVAGYCYERMPGIETVADAGASEGKRGGKPRTAAESRVLHSAVWDVRPGTDASQIWDVESPYETRLMRREGVVREVEEVPVFSRRRYCGQGYMALVEFSYAGFAQRVWAFGDPARPDSYLGQTSPAALPVAPGDVVTLWIAKGEGPNLVAPRDGASHAEAADGPTSYTS